MRKKRSKFCTKSIMLLLGTVILLMIAGFVAPTHAASAGTGQLATANVISAFDPFLLRTITFTPKLFSVSTMQVARAPRVSVNNGNNGNGNPPVLVPGRRSVRSGWVPGTMPPPKIHQPG
jgi:hypothetical protein